MNALLRHGAAVNEKNNDGDTALISASRKGNLDIVNVLLDRKARVDEKTPTGSTALMIASTYGHLGIVKRLFTRRADIHHTNIEGDTALMNASRMGYRDIVEFLLDRRAKIEAKDSIGRTALISASQFGRLNVVQILFDAGADVNAKDRAGETALMEASHYGFLDIVRFLLSHGANQVQTVINKMAKNSAYGKGKRSEILEMLNVAMEEQREAEVGSVLICLKNGYKSFVTCVMDNPVVSKAIPAIGMSRYTDPILASLEQCFGRLERKMRPEANTQITVHQEEYRGCLSSAVKAGAGISAQVPGMNALICVVNKLLKSGIDIFQIPIQTPDVTTCLESP